MGQWLRVCAPTVEGMGSIPGRELRSHMLWGAAKITFFKKSTNNKCWRRCGEKGSLLHFWWECKLVQSLWKAVWRFLKKLKIELPYDSAILLLGIYPDKTIIRKDTCTPMFFCLFFGHTVRHVGSYFPDQRSNPCSPQLERRVLTTGLPGKSHTPTFIAALFTIIKTWKQPKCPSTDEWIRKMHYTYTME